MIQKIIAVDKDRFTFIDSVVEPSFYFETPDYESAEAKEVFKSVDLNTYSKSRPFRLSSPFSFFFPDSPHSISISSQMFSLRPPLSSLSIFDLHI